MSNRVRCGRIVYTNDLPLYAAFDAGAVTFPGELHEAVPSELNRKLSAGELDVSPISAFHYLANAEEFVLLGDPCIGARDAVWSVVLVSQQPLDALDGVEIAVTDESASGRNLVRTILEGKLGVRPRYTITHDPLARFLADGTPALVIGDRAVDARLTLPEAQVHDLGKLWHAWTGEDMVFAVWAARAEFMRERAPEIFDVYYALRAARGWGDWHRDRVVAAAQTRFARPDGFYEAYYETLNFEFDDRARRGLARFARELQAIGAVSAIPTLAMEELHVAR